MSKNQVTIKQFLKKAFIGFCIFSAVCLLLAFINDVSATVSDGCVLIESCTSGTDGFGIHDVHPADTTNADSAVGQVFIANGTFFLTHIEFEMKKAAGSPNALMRAALASMTGAYGSNGAPNAVLATSTNTVNTTTLTGSQVYYPFDFDPYPITASTAYAVYVYAESADLLNSTNWVSVGASGTTNPHTGNHFVYHKIAAYGSWNFTQYTATMDVHFKLYKNATVIPTPSPTATPMPTALSFTLDMRGLGSVATPYSSNSAYGKEYFPRQSLSYGFYGHVWNYTNPYVNGNYEAYATTQRIKSTGNTTVDSWNDLTADDLTLVTSGAVSNGYFSLGVSAAPQIGSIEIYQGWRINGTVTGSSATFTTDFLVRWTEQGVVIIEPTGSAELPTPTPVGYQPVSYGYIVWYLVALVVVLLPAGILGVLFRFGAWGFIIGLAIGSGLGYMLMPTIVPLWLVFVVVIGIVGMLLKNTVLGNSGGSDVSP